MKKTLLTIGCILATVFSIAMPPGNDLGPDFIYVGTLNGHVYYKSTISYYASEAHAVAVAFGGHLVTLTSQAENDWIYSQAGHEDYLIGLKYSAQEGSFIWSNGEPVTYTNFNPGEPNFCCGGDPGEDYVEIIGDPIVGNNGKWNDVPGFQQLKVILEFDNPIGHAVYITSPVNGTSYPAPGQIILKAETFNTDAPIKSVSFYNGSALISNITSAPYSANWNNVPLGDYTITAVATDDAGNKATSLPILIQVAPDFVYIGTLNGHLYYKSTRYYHGNEVDAAAVPLGGYPVVITSQAEDDWIYSHAGHEDFLIGLNDIAQEGTFIWGDGEPVTYTNFNDGEPNDWNNGYPGEDYVQILGYNGKWNDLNVQVQLRFIVEVDNATIPVVYISSPSDDATYPAPGQILLTAEAFNPGSKIKSVSFYNGSILIFNETTAPYSRTWHNVPVGDYTITAVATDDKGGKITSAPVHVHVVPDKPPVVTLTSPANGASFAVPGDILLTADANDLDGNIKSVSFYDGSTLLFNETTAPYSRTWHKVPLGDYTITAVAADNGGNKTTSAPVIIHVVPDKPPVVALTSPADGATFTEPGNILLTANATDDRKIRSVSFYNGSTLIFDETTAPYSRTWHNVPAGDYNITAVAMDDAGNKTTSAPVNVHLVVGGSIPPIVTMTSPLNRSAIGFVDYPPFIGIIGLSADASDADGTVQKVDFYVNGGLVRTVNSPPYASDFVSTDPGLYILYAIATDNQGFQTTSGMVTVRLGGYYFDADGDGYGAGALNEPGLVVFTRPAGYIDIGGDCNDDDPNIHPTANEPCNGIDVNCDDYFCCNGDQYHVSQGECTACGVISNDREVCTPCGIIDVARFQCASCGIIGWDQQCTPCGVIDVNDVCDLGTLTIKKSSSKALNDINGNASIKLAPNPANNILNVHTIGLENSRQVSVSVITSLGLTVQTKQITGSVSPFQLDVSHLAKGVYTIRLMSDKKVVYKQFVKM